MTRSVLDFGADPTGVQDSWDAFDRACNEWPAVKGLHKYAGGKIAVPRGVYRLSKPLHLLRSVTIEGEGGGTIGATRLICEQGGIVSHNVLTARNAGLDGASQHSIIRDIQLIGNGVGEWHGVEMQSAITLEDCWIEGFGGDGINIECSSEVGSGQENSNRWQLVRVRSKKNRNGLKTRMGDANVGVAYACDFSINREWGIYEQSFLGNTYIACHMAHNGPANPNNPPGWTEGGALWSGRNSAKNVYIGCYQEGSNDKHKIALTTGDVVLGGVSFMADTTTRLPAGGHPLVLNEYCSRIPIKDGDYEMTLGGDSILSFRRFGAAQWYRLLCDTTRKVLTLRWANSPGHSIEFADEGHKEPVMTLTRVKAKKENP